MTNYLALLDSTTETTSGSSYWVTIIVYVVLFGAMIYFLIIRPQKKQQKQQDELMSSLEIGDSVLTTSGMYGVVIDKVDENVVIVEFGNNKNCRIPMKKTAIVEVEKPEGSAPASTTPVVDDKEGKKLFGKKDKPVKD